MFLLQNRLESPERENGPKCSGEWGSKMGILFSVMVCLGPNLGGHMIRPSLGKAHRGTSKNVCAFLEVRLFLVLLCFSSKRTSKKKFLRNLSLT